jgi:hypothetical protein
MKIALTSIMLMAIMVAGGGFCKKSCIVIDRIREALEVLMVTVG